MKFTEYIKEAKEIDWNNPPLMKCGCVANCVDGYGNPKCGTHNEWLVVQERDKPDLSGRVAHCVYCDREASSAYNLPFFELGADLGGEDYPRRIDKNSDWYYCGCRGWD